MRLVFAHDHIFRIDNDGKLYTGGSFNTATWERYLKHFDEMTVIARLGKMNRSNNKLYNEFNNNRAILKPIPSLSGPIKQYSNKKEAAKIIRNELLKADALIARLPSEIGNMAVNIAQDMKKPYMVEVVACVWDTLWYYGKAIGKIYAPAAKYKMQKRVRQSPYALYVTEKFLQTKYPNYGVNIAVSDVEITDIGSSTISRRNKICKIGMIGSTSNKIKGWEVALRALKLLYEKGIDYEFYILGDGDDKLLLNTAKEMGIQERIHICGIIPSGEPVMEWLDKIDIYIQPSYTEGLPRAVIEAMSRGCAVIGSDVGGMSELIDKSCLHRRGDYKQLALIIEKVIENRDYYYELSERNIDFSRKFMKEILDRSRDKFLTEFIEKFG
jgi:glycosyltransferase involved in cell wall biosynthesis